VRRLALALGVLVASAALADGPEPAPAPPPAMLDALFPGGRTSQALADLAARATLAPSEDFRAVEVARDAASSHHVVAIRHAETLHRHDRHDLLVVMLRGHGSTRLGAETRPVGEGSILYVPRGTAHAFSNAAAEPAVAYAVYFPPFDGADRVPAD
jgi:mannose-6-phosphate isomerase-like protein (cupin superfamily)